jgi:hypothetical protein
LISIYLRDSTGTAFDSDALTAEPDLSSFDVTRFGVRNFDSSGTQNYLICGDLTGLFDVPLINSVPEPSTVFLLGLGLVAMFFAGRRKMTAKIESIN